MSVKQISMMCIFSSVIFALFNMVGLGTTTLILAFLFLVQGIVFTLKPENFDIFMKFMNPKLFNVYIEKGEEFVKKKRKMSIVSYYILFILFTFNGIMQLKNKSIEIEKELFGIKNYLYWLILVLFVGIISNYFSKILMKKSRTANEELVWSIVLGGVIAVLMIVSMMFFIFYKTF